MKRPRETLVEIFKGGKATGKNYVDLIESTVNIQTDGIDFDKDNGLKLTSRGSSHKLMSFYEAMSNDRNPAFTFHLNPDSRQGLNLTEGREQSRLFFESGQGNRLGRIGIGTTKPSFGMDVRGVVGMQGRAGNFATGKVMADGSWHTIKDNLHGCMGFEAMAHINDEEDERFALTHAILLMSGGKKRGSKVKATMVRAGSKWFWGRFWNKILFRWKLDEENSKRSGERRYLLQIKTRTHYGTKNGQSKELFYRLMLLWDRNFEKEVHDSPLESNASHQQPQRFPGNNQDQGGNQRQNPQGGSAIKPKPRFNITPKR
ncbi:MAG: hypothetical protein AAF399_21405 [Bacteroidota bacterium]